jgi:hypothetical protein
MVNETPLLEGRHAIKTFDAPYHRVRIGLVLAWYPTDPNFHSGMNNTGHLGVQGKEAASTGYCRRRASPQWALQITIRGQTSARVVSDSTIL